MSDDPERDPAAPEDGREEEAAATPFDNPFFFPVILWGLALYFGFDIVTDSEAYQKWPKFNLGGFAILSAAAIYYTRSAIREKRAGREGRTD
jgi:hypothetical protein